MLIFILDLVLKKAEYTVVLEVRRKNQPSILHFQSCVKPFKGPATTFKNTIFIWLMKKVFYFHNIWNTGKDSNIPEAGRGQHFELEWQNQWKQASTFS